MWDSFLSIEFDRYGFTIDSYYFYFSLSWLAIGVISAAAIAYRIYKHYKADYPMYKI
jgi:hypothetical protein